MNKKIAIASLFIISLLAMGVVSASENITDDILTQDSNADILSDDFIEYEEGTGKVNPNMQVYWPDRVLIGEECIINFTLPEDVDEDAMVVLYVNGERVDDGVFVAEEEYAFNLDESGTFGLKLKFMGDDYYAFRESARVYSLSPEDYVFDCEFDSEIIYGSENNVTVRLPEDATGSIDVNGYIYTLDDETGYVSIPLTNLNLGNNEVSIAYSGNGKYPSKKITKSVNVISKVIYDFSMDFDNVEFILSLPGNPGGTFTVTVDENITRSSRFTNGISRITFDDLSLGLHKFTPSYDGTDYSLDLSSQSGTDFDVVAKVTVDSFKTVDDENSICIEFPKNFQTLVNVTLTRYESEYQQSVLKEYSYYNYQINNSKANLSFSKLPAGYYQYDISYRISDYQWDVYDRSPAGFITKEFRFEVTPQSVAVAEGDQVEIIFTHDRGAEGSVALYCGGVYVDEVFLEPNAVRTVFMLEGYRFDMGENVFTAVFEGDDLYAPVTRTFTITATYARFDIPEAIVINERDSITLYALNDATGYLAIYVEGKLLDKADLEDGQATISLADLEFKTHNVKVVYEGGNYPSMSKSIKIRVTYTLSMEDESTIYGGDNIYTIILPEELTSTGLAIKIDNKTYGYSQQGNYVYVDISDLGLGEHTIVASHPGSDRFYAINVERTIDVAAEIVIPNDVVLGSDSYIYLILPKYPEGYLVAKYFNPAEGGNVQSYFGFEDLDDFRSIAKIPLSRIEDVGDYEFEVSYDGTDFDVPSKTETVHVGFNITFAEELEYGQTQIIEVDMPGVTGSLAFYLNGEYYASYRFRQEGAAVTLRTLEAGTYDFYITGEDSNFDFDYEGTFSVYPKITVPENVIDGAGSITVNPGDYGEGYVTVYVDGEEFEYTDLEEGEVSIPLKSLSAGVHEIEVEYESLDGYFHDGTYTVNVKKSTITAKDMSMSYLDGSKFKVLIRNAYGKAVGAGQSVKFYVAGKLFKTAKTDKNGYAYVVLTHVPKTYAVKVVYKATAVSKKVTVKQILSIKKVTPKKSAKSLVLTATLKKVNGKYLKNKKIIFTFNGKKYAAKTNKKGVAKVTIKKAVLSKLKVGKKITYQATYVKSTVKQTVKVKK